MQEAFNAVERVPQPVIAAVHGACIGAGVDLISACDIRLCTEDVIYSIRVSSGWRTGSRPGGCIQPISVSMACPLDLMRKHWCISLPAQPDRFHIAVRPTLAIQEVQIGLAADMGTLQRLPRAIGNHSLLRELAYTGTTSSPYSSLFPRVPVRLILSL